MPVYLHTEKLLRRKGIGAKHAAWAVRLVWRCSYIALLALLAALIPFFAQLGGERFLAHRGAACYFCCCLSTYCLPTLHGTGLVGGLGILPLCYILPILMWQASAALPCACLCALAMQLVGLNMLSKITGLQHGGGRAPTALDALWHGRSACSSSHCRVNCSYLLDRAGRLQFFCLPLTSSALPLPDVVTAC